MAKWLKAMEQWIGGGPGGDKRIKTFRYLILIGLIGAAIMIFTSFLNVKEVDPYAQGRDSPMQAGSQDVFLKQTQADASPFEMYEKQYEERLKDTLEKIVGVDQVNVLITIDSTEEQIFQKNTSESQSVTEEKDSGGATRHITNISRSGEVVLYEVSDQQTPLIVKTIKPRIRGVIVVASGAENLTIKKLLIEAVQKGLNVPAHKISVLPRKQQQ